MTTPTVPPHIDPLAFDVLAFWFGDADSARNEWFAKNDAFDDAIRTRFGGLIDDAVAGALDAWGDAPPAALARIVVLDQFTRNVFRGTPRAFAGDVLALESARRMVARNDDLSLPPLQRVFAYMPFEHAEDLAAQREALRLFGRLANDAPALAGYVEWAQKHHDVIERFGRFPHRNPILGRDSTPEEKAYLAQPGSGF